MFFDELATAFDIFAHEDAEESLGLAGLSMGMSDDFEAAVEEGATVVRVGTALFGTRA